MNELARGTSQTSQTSGRVSDTDYTGWLTKAEAAAALNVTTKTIERLTAERLIQHATTQRLGRGPKIAVYHPDDVARVAQERRTAPAAFVLPAGVTSPVNGKGHGSPSGLQLATPELSSSGQDLLRAFAVALRGMSETSKTPTLFLTIPEAAALSGLSQANLRRRCQSGWPGAIKDGAWKIRRKDLEAL